ATDTECRLWPGRNLEIGDARDSTPQSMSRVGPTEIVVTVTAGSAKSDTVATTSDGDICNRLSSTVDGDKSIDASFQRLAKQRSHPAKIAEAFLADGRCQDDRSFRLNVGGGERARDRNQDRQPTA